MVSQNIPNANKAHKILFVLTHSKQLECCRFVPKVLDLFGKGALVVLAVGLLRVTMNVAWFGVGIVLAKVEVSKELNGVFALADSPCCTWRH